MMLVIKQNIFKIRHIDNDEQTKPKIYLKFDIMIMMNRTRGKHNYTNTSVRANRDLGKIIFQKKIKIFLCLLVKMLPPDES